MSSPDKKDPEEEKGEEEVRDAWDSSDEDVELEKTVSPTLTSSSSAPSSKTPSRLGIELFYAFTT